MTIESYRKIVHLVLGQECYHREERAIIIRRIDDIYKTEIEEQEAENERQD